MTANARLFRLPPWRSDPNTIGRYFATSGLTFLNYSTTDKPSTTSILSIDGACPSNGNNPTSASWGIYFGPNSPYNSSGLLPSELRKTNNVAEIYAALKAIQLVTSRVKFGSRKIEEVVVKCDSTWLVDSLTIWIDGWKSNGWMTAEGKPVKNKELLIELDDLIEEVKIMDGIHVKFLHVRRKLNARADLMANISLSISSADGSELYREETWKRQLAGTACMSAKQLWLDLFLLRWDAITNIAPRLEALEFPIIGKGEWMAALRIFVFLHMTEKLKFIALGSERSKVQDMIFTKILGKDWRSKMNKDIGSHRTQVFAEIQKFNLVRGTTEVVDGQQRAGKHAVLADVNNHLAMSILGRSISCINFYVKQDDMRVHNLIWTRLADEAKWDAASVSALGLYHGVQPSRPGQETVTTTTYQTTSPTNEEEDLPQSGVRLEWSDSDEWEELGRPSRPSSPFPPS